MTVKMLGSNLLVGDIIELEEEMYVPAGCLLISGDHLFVDENEINPQLKDL